MGQYTLHDNPLVDATVQQHLDIIRDCILSHLRPEAILLSGSFGRGEGTVQVRGSTVHFFSDYEITVISRAFSNRFTMERAGRALAQRVPVEVSLSWMTPNRLRRNRSRNLSIIPSAPGISMYELKAGSRMLYGEFDLTANQPDPLSLPTWEAIRLVQNRMIDLVENLNRQAGRTALAFSAAKLVLACGDALLLHRGYYHYSYAERARRFVEQFERDYCHFLDDHFLERYRAAASFKLLPFVEHDEEDVLQNLEAVRQASKTVLRELSYGQLEQNLGHADEPGRRLSATGILPLSYRTGISPAADRRYENGILALRARRSGKRIYWRQVPRTDPHLSLLQLLYLTIPALFFGIALDGRGDTTWLSRAAYFGQWMMGPESPSPDRLEQELSRATCAMWHAIR